MHSHKISTPTGTPVPDEKVKELSSNKALHSLSYFFHSWNFFDEGFLYIFKPKYCLCNHFQMKMRNWKIAPEERKNYF